MAPVKSTAAASTVPWARSGGGKIYHAIDPRGNVYNSALGFRGVTRVGFHVKLQWNFCIASLKKFLETCLCFCFACFLVRLATTRKLNLNIYNDKSLYVRVCVRWA